MKFAIILSVFLLFVFTSAEGYKLTITSKDNISLSADEDKQVRRNMDFIISFYEKNFGFKINSNLDFRILLKKPVPARKEEKVKKIRKGFFSSKKRFITVFMRENNPKSNVETISHEISHAILNEVLERETVKQLYWLNEGLSEYFEKIEFQDKNALILPDTAKDNSLKKTAKIISLKDFIALDNRQWKELNKGYKNMAYHLSWGLVYFLLETRQGTEIIRQTLLYARQHPKEKELALKSFNAALSASLLYKDLNTLESAFRSWIALPRNNHKITLTEP